jgi:DNA-directed RNA polymerase subunit RPC12/RpoP
METPVPQPKSTDQNQYPCSQCGAKLDYAPGTSSLTCPYCGFANPIQQSEAPVEELELRAYLDRAAEEKRSSDAQRIKCGSCGAETTLPPEATSGLCPFCGANMVFSGKVSRLIRPEGLLPFQVTRKDAFESFRRWIQKLWFAPGDLKRYAQSDGRLVGVYVPYWTYDSETTSSYTGERGDYYTVTETYTATENGRSVMRAREVRRTRWTPASGVVANRFDDILILASKSLPRKYAESLEPWDLAGLVPYADEYLSGFRAESYHVSLDEGFDEAKRVMAGTIREAIRRDIGGDEQRIHSVSTQYGKITFKHILLPVWMSAYRFRNRIFRILINARTGEVQGERPYSAWKIAAAILAGACLVAILALLTATSQ